MVLVASSEPRRMAQVTVKRQEQDMAAEGRIKDQLVPWVVLQVVGAVVVKEGTAQGWGL